MFALCSVLLHTYYAHFNAGIIGSPLAVTAAAQDGLRRTALCSLEVHSYMNAFALYHKSEVIIVD